MLTAGARTPLGPKQENFRKRRWGSSLSGLRTRDPPLGPPSTLAEIFRHPCLQSSLHSTPPVLQKSFPVFQTPTTTPCKFSPKLGFCPPNLGFFGGGTGTGGVPKWFGGLIYTFDGKKKPPVKCQNSSLPPSKIGKKYLKIG